MLLSSLQIENVHAPDIKAAVSVLVTANIQDHCSIANGWWFLEPARSSPGQDASSADDIMSTEANQ